MKKLLTILSIIICSVTYGQKGVGLRLEYNKTSQPKVVPLNGFYMNMKGQYLSTSITIPANSSVMMIKLDTPPLALQVQSFSLSTGVNTTTLQTVVLDDVTGQRKTLTFKYRFR